jgi:hypothetical protein
MCFVLYAGTMTPLPRRSFDKDSSDLPVESLTERDAAIKQHFSAREVQYIGSSSSCGCAFPHAMYQSGGWPEIDYREPPQDELDRARERTELQNREALVALLRTTGDEMIELYGVWDGDFATPPQSIEEIPIARLLDANFCFKEQGFYKISL